MTRHKKGIKKWEMWAAIQEMWEIKNKTEIMTIYSTADAFDCKNITLLIIRYWTNLSLLSPPIIWCYEYTSMLNNHRHKIHWQLNTNWSTTTIKTMFLPIIILLQYYNYYSITIKIYQSWISCFCVDIYVSGCWPRSKTNPCWMKIQCKTRKELAI